MRAKNTIRSFFDYHLITRVFLRNPARGIPSGSHFLGDPEFQALLARLGLAKSHGSCGRNRKDHGWDTRVIGLLMISLQQIRRNDRAFIVGHGSKRRTSAGSSVARRVNGRVRHALQERIDSYTLAVPRNSCRIQVHVIDFSYTTCSMDHHVRLECALLTRSGGANNQLTRPFLNAYDFGAELNINPKLTSMLHNLIDQVRVKACEGAQSTMCDGDLRSRTHRY